jgi:cephalosporin hydroxylase
MRARRVMLALLESGPRATWMAVQAKRKGAKQKLREFARFVRLIRKVHPTVVVEIGTMKGGTLWAWCRLAAPDALLVSIDLPDGEFGSKYSAEIERLRTIARPSQRLELIRADSHSESTLEQLRAILDGRPIDFLFIDGDHTYEGVRQDYEMYSPLVKDLIAFHDIVPCRPQDGDVNRLWTSLRNEKSLDLVDAEDAGSRGPWGGIGVLYV